MDKNYWEDHFDELPMFLQIIIARLKAHFDLSLMPGILKNKLESLYSKDELIEIADILNKLESKLNDKEGNYRELN